MYKNLEVISKVEHKDSNIKLVENFSYAKEEINAPVTVAEFYEACKNYPIVFAKDKDNVWFASIMLGYKEKQNIFVDDKGEWEKLHYIPAAIRRYPFIFINQEKSEDLILGIEKDYLSSDKKDESRKLFEKEDNSELLNGVLKFLNQFQNDAKVTSNFIKQLADWDLLEEKVATILNSNQEKFIINGFFIVNEDKLKHLSKKKKEEICNKNLSPLITAHLISLSNIQKLGMKYKQR